MLLAHCSPKQIIIRQGFPALADLCGSSKRDSIKVAHTLQAQLSWKNGEWVKSTLGFELFGKER